MVNTSKQYLLSFSHQGKTSEILTETCLPIGISISALKAETTSNSRFVLSATTATSSYAGSKPESSEPPTFKSDLPGISLMKMESGIGVSGRIKPQKSSADTSGREFNEI